MALGHPIINELQRRQRPWRVFHWEVSCHYPNRVLTKRSPWSRARFVRYLRRDVLHAVCILKGTSGLDSFRRRTETASMFQDCFESIDQFARVAAEAEFAGLLFLENELKSSGVFFLKRNDNVGKGRTDPSLKESLCKAVVL